MSVSKINSLGFQAKVEQDASSAITPYTALEINNLPVSASNPIYVSLQPVASGGTLVSSAIMAATTNATLVKSSAGQVYNISLTNNSATVAYLKLYNSATIPTAGAGTPVFRLMIPANTTIGLSLDSGLSFTNGIGYTVTGGIADTDVTAVAASVYIVNIIYK